MQNKYSFSFTPLAFQDLDDALAYISEQLSNPQAATELLEEVEHTLASVCEFPYAFSDCSVYLISDQNIRHAMVKNYVLVFEINEGEGKIIVLRFRYARTDMAHTTMKKDDDSEN